MEYLNFQEISKVSFKSVLDWLNIPYTETDKEYKGQGFIVTKHKNLYVNPTGEDKGSVINFVAIQEVKTLREAAKLIKDKFLAVEPKRQIPTLELEYHPYLENIAPPELCQTLGVGYCKSKSIMNSRICFKVGDHYIGYSPEKNNWLFPKGFKRDTLWNLDNCTDSLILVTNDPFKALKVIHRGYKNTASFMGSDMTEEQKHILDKYEFVFIG